MIPFSLIQTMDFSILGPTAPYFLAFIAIVFLVGAVGLAVNTYRIGKD